MESPWLRGWRDAANSAPAKAWLRSFKVSGCTCPHLTTDGMCKRLSASDVLGTHTFFPHWVRHHHILWLPSDLGQNMSPRWVSESPSDK